MKDIVNKIASLLNNNHGVDSKDITVIEERLNAAFPQDYITLLKRSNGGEGYVGENYISLWKVEDLPALNEDYQIQKYLSENGQLFLEINQKLGIETLTLFNKFSKSQLIKDLSRNDRFIIGHK